LTINKIFVELRPEAPKRTDRLHPNGNTSLRDNAGRRYFGHANFHPIALAIRNPVGLMGAIASLTTGEVMERHPKPRAGLLEGTAGAELVDVVAG
jgi:hypothetical protein